MFQKASTFNADISKWDTSRVVNIEGMFVEAILFNSDITRWDLGNVSTMKDLFGRASSFNVLAAMGTGIARRCVDVMGKYAQDRQAFGQPIANFGQIQRYVSDAYAKYQAGRCYLYRVANQMDIAEAGQRLAAADWVYLGTHWEDHWVRRGVALLCRPEPD